ncbi:hypothetical protein [Neorhizobium vignae]|uniref:hypothetical protein n=1 Tax=Neorhizobium vignae TaxID=690585 RepID=UPI00068B48F5|nr:hypothetical protein [Neorhizobium vignae]
MTDLLTPALAVAAVKFKWQKGEDTRTYDYFVPHGLDLAAGDKVMVETKRGETEVEVVEIKAESEMASKLILRRADPAPAETAPAAPKSEWDF